jgi:uncharacterized membrane protein YbhN (UPF0104 family)
MSRKKLVTGIKLCLLIVILAVVGWNVYAAWRDVGMAQLRTAIEIDWRWSTLSLLGLACVLLTSATAWFWLLRRLDPAGSPVQLYGAYCFSHMGKYVPGKVMLLLMRLERADRLGVAHLATTLSTIMENAAYMVSGAAVGIAVLLHFLVQRNPAGHLWLLLVATCSVVVLLVAIHPGVFYRLTNQVLNWMGRPVIEPGRRLPMSAVMVSGAMMVPCWFFGGLALWATTRCLVPVDFSHFWVLMSAYALSILLGIFSFLPGGLGVRELVQGYLLLPVVSASIPASETMGAEATIIVAMVVMLQRLCQLTTETGLGLLGGILTGSGVRRVRE